MGQEGLFVIFSVVTGEGKSRIIEKLLKEEDKTVYIPSKSTRSKREDGSEGVPYYFTDKG